MVYTQSNKIYKDGFSLFVQHHNKWRQSTSNGEYCHRRLSDVTDGFLTSSLVLGHIARKMVEFEKKIYKNTNRIVLYCLHTRSRTFKTRNTTSWREGGGAVTRGYCVDVIGFFWGGVGLSIHKKSPDGSPSRRYKRMHLGFGAHNFMAVEYKKGNNSQEHTCTVHVRVMTWSPCSARSSSPCWALQPICYLAPFHNETDW